MKISNLVLHPLFAGSAVMIFGNNFVNFLAYLYHLVLGRMLGPTSYGDLAAIISLIGLITILPNGFLLTIVKFISSSKSKREVGQLLSWLTKLAAASGLIFAAVFIIFAHKIAPFFQLQDSTQVFWLAPIVFISLPLIVNRATLQGLLKFTQLVVSLVAEVGIKLVGGVALVIAGFSVAGAVGAIFLGALVGWLLTHLFLRAYRGWEAQAPAAALIKYGVPVFFNSLATMSFISTDLLLVKHFFPPQEGGIYAATAILGRIIFWGAAPVAAVMFPMVSRQVSQDKSYKKIFYLSLLFTLLIAGLVLSIYLFLPKVAVGVLYGSSYFGAIPYLFPFGVFMTLFSLSSLIVSLFLSLGKTGVVLIPAMAAILQAAGIWFFHDSLQSVIFISLLASGIMFLSLVVYLWYASAKKI